MKKTILVIGASRGIGAEVVKHFSENDHRVMGVSRSQAKNCEWIQADISSAEGIKQLFSTLGQTPIDTLIYSSGVWEDYGFTKEFDFQKTSESETRQIMSVNLVAPIEITKRAVANLSLSTDPRAIYLGALSGMEQWASSQVAYTASKFGLRGAIQGLRLALKQQGIGFSVINPGNVATEEVLLDIQEGRCKQQTPIPMSDILSTLDWLLSLSASVEVGDINLIQRDSI
ncbi:SDR family oxidoreductase [Maricurvus nonylphenolicus]|uniref:SDR family NAD(P)-dependent oxidoreductase n=1 Tax=Maricurvus nonylphenolicus TaxID=1008307 RepID=UPI0036F2FD06